MPPLDKFSRPVTPTSLLALAYGRDLGHCARPFDQSPNAPQARVDAAASPVLDIVEGEGKATHAWMMGCEWMGRL